MIELSLVLKQLRDVSDEQLREELRRYRLEISDSKFSTAFSSYGVTRWLLAVPISILRVGAPPMPDQELNSVRWQAVFMYRAYIAFVYMRSEHLEKGLDNVADNSCLLPFKRFFRSGSKKQGEDTIAQHIRNSLTHGTCELSQDLQTVFFRDRQWQAKVSISEFFDGLCEEVYRFYSAAYDTH